MRIASERESGFVMDDEVWKNVVIQSYVGREENAKRRERGKAF
jgi:hypothetical protein